MLQRIYGTAWFTKEDLEAYLRRLEEARKRDHRVLGKQLDLFSVLEEVLTKMIFWHPKGAMMQFQLRRFMEDVILERGYQLVYTPHITREQLFLKSGHLPLYGENQFPPMAAGEGEAEDVRYRVKPMNCPMHILIYAAQQRSYRDLPIRLAEIANVYRNERSGTLHGMLRVRGLTMDDAHLFLPIRSRRRSSGCSTSWSWCSARRSGSTTASIWRRARPRSSARMRRGIRPSGRSSRRSSGAP